MGLGASREPGRPASPSDPPRPPASILRPHGGTVVATLRVLCPPAPGPPPRQGFRRKLIRGCPHAPCEWVTQGPQPAHPAGGDIPSLLQPCSLNGIVCKGPMTTVGALLSSSLSTWRFVSLVNIPVFILPRRVLWSVPCPPSRPALDATCGKTVSSTWRSPLGSDVLTGFPPRLLCQVAHLPPRHNSAHPLGAPVP